MEYIEIRTKFGRTLCIPVRGTLQCGAHTDAGDLEIELVAPSGQVSLLNELRPCTGGNCGSQAGHCFGSALHPGENLNGNWTLIARDLATDHSGTLKKEKRELYT